MGELLAWASAGEIRPPATTIYPLDRVADAQRDLESGRTTGKLVLTP
jgi:NADPH:quinone reductase-like Zn-dependent oxidoreductase